MNVWQLSGWLVLLGVVLLIVVFILQSLGNALARRTTNRGLFRKVHK